MSDTGLFDIDENGDFTPSVEDVEDEFFELDENGDIQSK